MIKLIITFLLFFSLINFVLAQDKVAEYDTKTNKYGIKDVVLKKWLTLPSYDDIYPIYQTINGERKTEYFIAKKNTKKIIISKNGVAVLSPAFDEIKILQSNFKLCIVKKQGSFSFFEIGKGVLNALGSFNEFNDLNSEDKYFKIKREKHWYIFRTDIKKYSSVPYDQIAGSINGNDSSILFNVKKTKWGIVNIDGKEIVPFDFDSLVPTTLFAVIKAKKKNKFGVLDMNGKEIIPTEYDSLDISELLYGDVITKKNNKWGLLELSGKSLLENKYDKLDPALPHLIRKAMPDSLYFLKKEHNFLPVKLNGKWGIINVDFPDNPIIPFDYDSICNVNVQKKILLVIKEGKMGLIDFNNKIVYPFLFDGFERLDANFVKESKEKLYLVNMGCTNCIPWSITGGKFGIADSTGKIILDPNANAIKLMNKPYDQNYEGEDSTFFGYLWNFGGEKIESQIGADTIMFEDPYALEMGIKVEKIFSYNIKGGKTGIINRYGKYIMPALFDDFVFVFVGYNPNTEREMRFMPDLISNPSRHSGNIYHIDTTLDIIAVKEKKYGVYNWNGKEIIPCIFDSIAYEFCSLDVSDSIFKTRKYLRQFYRVFLNGSFGYYSLNGEKLIAPEIKNNLQQLEFLKLDSLLANNNYSPNWNDLFFGQIVCKNEVAKKLILYPSNLYGEDEFGLNIISPPEEFDYVEKGEFTVLDRGKVKLLSEFWFDDLIFMDAFARSYKFSDMRSQLFLRIKNDIDSIKDKSSNKIVLGKIQKPAYMMESPYFLDYFFAKKQGKWYLTSIYNSTIASGALGFDSIWTASKNTFKGFLNGKYSYYPYTNKSFLNPDIDLEFPDQSDFSHIVCKNCIYEMKKYHKADTIALLDEIGNYIKDTIDRYTYEIPFVKNGVFNILNENKQLVLNTWANEIRIPVPSVALNFSITDSTSSVYDKKNWNTPNGWPLYNEYKKSIALKYDNIWRLTTIQNQDIIIDGFDDVKFAGEYWEAKKDGKIYFYLVDGLKLKE